MMSMDEGEILLPQQSKVLTHSGNNQSYCHLTIDKECAISKLLSNIELIF